MKTPSNPTYTSYVVAIVKGMIEKHGSHHHFGSLNGYLWHFEDAQAAELIDAEGGVTEKGKQEYERLKWSELPDGRAKNWFIATHQKPSDYGIDD